MKRAIGASCAILLSVVGLAGSGSAIESVSHGSLCKARDSAEFSKIRYDQSAGAQNESTTATAFVECGSSIPFQNITSASFMGFDRNPTSNVCCNINLQNSAGGLVVASAQRCTSGFDSEGLTSPAFSPPAGTTASIASFSCSIPPKTSNGYSQVTRYRVLTQ